VNDKVHAAMTPEKTMALLAELKAEAANPAFSHSSSKEALYAVG
jgi:hypothetical protein